MNSVEPPQLSQVAPSLRAVSGRLSPERWWTPNNVLAGRSAAERPPTSTTQSLVPFLYQMARPPEARRARTTSRAEGSIPLMTEYW